MTTLPVVDAEAVAAFWGRAIDRGAVPAGTPVPAFAGPFGDSVELADELIALVVGGPKRATAGSVAEYEHHAWPWPEVGDRWIATDGSGRPRAVIRTTEVRHGPLSSVDDAFAWDEGEGDRTRGSWLRDHHEYFGRALPSIGHVFHDDIDVVFERFAVDFQESSTPVRGRGVLSMRVRGSVVALGLLLAGLLGAALGAALQRDGSDGSVTATSTSTSITRSGSTASTTSTSGLEPARGAFVPCAHDQLEAGIGGYDSAVGTASWTVVVANRGAPCSLLGWPSVAFLDEKGRELPIIVEQVVAQRPEPVDLFRTAQPFVVHDTPLVEAAQLAISTEIVRGDGPGIIVYRVDRIVLRLPGVPGSFTIPADELELAETVSILPLSGPRGTVRD